MEAAEQAWRPLGELLLSKNLIARTELDEALSEQGETGKLLGAILVDRGFISGPALAIALAEQCGVELDQQQGFGTGLWAQIERRHRSERGIEDPEPEESEEPEPEEVDEEMPQITATVVKLEPMHAPPPLEAVPDPGPDPQLEQLEVENRRLQEEIERVRSEFTKLRVIEAELRERPDPEPDPRLEQLESENKRLQEAIESLHSELTELRVIEDPRLEQFETENKRFQEEIERLQSELMELRASEAELRQQGPDPEQFEQLEAENTRLQEEIEQLRSEFTELRAIEAELREQMPDPEPEPELPKSHVLFVPTPTGYLLLEREGPPPDPDSGVWLSSEGSFVVGKVGRAPVPGERRACAFLLAS